MSTCGGPECALAVALALTTVCWSAAYPEVVRECHVSVRLDSGVVCGDTGQTYVSFLGVPYAKQPLGELRFKELQPVDSWEGVLQATVEGPKCPQHDVLYGELIPNQVQDEACIHANIHVPKDVLPGADTNRQDRIVRSLQPPHQLAYNPEKPGAPILVFVHGGGFNFGSGDVQFHGPDHLVKEGVIVITFNYRINVFGFLSLNSDKIPGNNGLRDIVTLLRWVRRNARSFGGDPDNVTLGGQSAGASAAHLLSLSDAAKGLFKRVVIMSGTAIPTFYTTSPLYAKLVADILITNLGINSTDPDEIHEQLVATPLEAIMAVNKALINQFGLTVFQPVIESRHSGILRILNEDTEVSLAKGRGSDIPLLVGYVNKECETFRPRLRELDILSQLKVNPVLFLPTQLIYSKTPDVQQNIINKIQERYFDGALSLDNYVKACSEEYYEYPALKVLKYRQASGGAPVFLYRFSYNADHSAIKYALKLDYNGSAHIEDLTFVFDVKSIPHLGSSERDVNMKLIMTQMIVNFMKYSDPTDSSGFTSWRPATSNQVYFQSIERPEKHSSSNLTEQQLDVLNFFDSVSHTETTGS